MKTKWALFLVGKNSPNRNPKGNHIPSTLSPSEQSTKQKQKKGRPS